MSKSLQSHAAEFIKAEDELVKSMVEAIESWNERENIVTGKELWRENIATAKELWSKNIATAKELWEAGVIAPSAIHRAILTVIESGMPIGKSFHRFLYCYFVRRQDFATITRFFAPGQMWSSWVTDKPDHVIRSLIMKLATGVNGSTLSTKDLEMAERACLNIASAEHFEPFTEGLYRTALDVAQFTVDKSGLNWISDAKKSLSNAMSVLSSDATQARYLRACQMIKNAKSIAIVAKGSSLMHQSLGKQIDDHDLVIRMNSPKGLLPERHGSRTSIMFAMANSAERDPGLYQQWKSSFAQESTLTLPITPYKICKAKKALLKFFTSFGYAPSTTGHRTIALAMLLCSGTVDVYGFDLYNDKRVLPEELHPKVYSYVPQTYIAGLSHEIDYEFWFIHVFLNRLGLINIKGPLL